MTNGKPIVPTQVIPAGAPLPAPTAPPAPPPAPPAPPPPPPAQPPGWWSSAPPPLPVPVPVDVHVTVHVEAGRDPEPERDPPWWRRIRWGYHLGMAVLAFPVSGPWAVVLHDLRDDKGLTAAWVMAAVVWALLAVWDNVSRIRSECAHPEAWLPKLRAFVARLLLYAVITATVLTLPLTTLVYWITGARTP